MINLTLPYRTWAHAVPVSVKLGGLLVLSAAVFPVRDLGVLAGILVVAVVLTISAGRLAVRRSVGFLKGLLVMAALILAYHVATDDSMGGAVIVCRLFALVLLANFVTMTTPLTEIMALVDVLLSPLARLGFNTRVVSVAIGLVIRFLPTLMQAAVRLRESWRIRSLKSPGWRLVAPLVLSVLDDADRVSDALRARGGVVRLENSGFQRLRRF